MESNKIQSALEYWHSRLSQECGEDHILNITLYGSQNYNIDTPYSDVDVKAIYVPCLADAVLENKWTSFEFHNIQNEHCELKDIREMCKMYQKQNLNFLETLFTEYRWDNPKYKEINDAFKSRAEDIAHYNIWYGVKSTCGQALNTIKQLRNNPTDLKKFAKVIYLYLYLNKYIDGCDYHTVGGYDSDQSGCELSHRKVRNHEQINTDNRYSKRMYVLSDSNSSGQTTIFRFYLSVLQRLEIYL